MPQVSNALDGQSHMSFLDQRHAVSRCDWGVTGHDSLAPAAVVIVIDVLSFSTCIDIAVGRGVGILPYRWKDDSARAFAKANGAELAGSRGTSRYSLSPLSFHVAPVGLRCVLPSPNGAVLSLRASESGSVVLSGCLRNASAVAAAATRIGATFNVCPAGERWPDGSLRFATEDWLAAGAILRLLPGPHSPEALAAVGAFEQASKGLGEALAGSSSGRELIEQGFDADVECAAQFDTSSLVPWLLNGMFVNAPEPAV
jgi:2-phosphosulfolactate phosphatase